MKTLKRVKTTALLLACTGILLPDSTVIAGPPASKAKSPTRTLKPAAPRTLDVALTKDGVLKGQVLNSQGVGLDGAVVSIYKGSRRVAQAVTDARGQYSVRNLRPGLYSIRTPQSTSLVRVWPLKAAPPIASKSAIVIARQPVVRGQIGMLDPMTAVVIGASIATVTLSAINLSKNSDIEDDVRRLEAKVDRLPTSP